MALGQEQTLGVENTVNTTVDKIELALTTIITKVSNAIPNLLLGLVLLFIGLFFVRTLLKIIDRRFESRNVDPSLRGFLRSVISFILYALLIITVISNVGIQTTSFIAVMSAVALGVGSALQGSLSNFAGGVLILIFRPYEVGDYIENNSGTEGTVQKIDLLYTTLINAKGIMVFSPNGPLANSVIRNFTKISSRRIDYAIGISYNDNIKVAREVILKVISQEKRVLQTPAPEVFVDALADSSVNLIVRMWTERADYWSTYSSLQEKIKVALDEANISIPFPQQELHIIKGDTKELDA